MKKVFLIFLALIFSLYFVSAQAGATSFADSLVKLVTGAIDVATRAGGPLFSALFGDVQAGSDLFRQPQLLLLFYADTLSALTGYLS